MTDTDELIDDVREFLEGQPMTGADWPAILDDVNYHDKHGYRGEFRVEPDYRQEDVIFEVGLAVGYACGVREVERSDE